MVRGRFPLKHVKLQFLFDVDNTLLDNDRVIADIQMFLRAEVGRKLTDRYWRIFEKRREGVGYADYLGALQEFRQRYPHDPHLLALSDFLINYPFANVLYPRSLDAIRQAQRLGRAAILSDGDVVFQPRKINRSGLADAVNGNVFVYIHKEKELAQVRKCLPATHYIVIDDKIRILSAIKKKWSKRVTTVFVRQGHYAFDQKLVSQYPAADLTLNAIGELCELGCARLLSAA